MIQTGTDQPLRTVDPLEQDFVDPGQLDNQMLNTEEAGTIENQNVGRHMSQRQSSPTQQANVDEPNTEQPSLGSSLQVDNSLGQIVEYLVCLKKFRDAETNTSQTSSDPLVELVLLSPTRALMFIKLSILFSIFVSFLLCVPEFMVSKLDNFTCEKCLKLITVWLYVYRMIILTQFIFRVLFYYIFSQLDNKANQEIIYCMCVITQGRGWIMSRKLTSFSYFWYGLGMIIHRLPNMCNRRWLYAFIFYILSVNVLRFAVTVVLYYFTFPPSHEAAKRLNRGARLVLPKRTYKEAKLDPRKLRSVSCGICLDDFVEEDILRVLTCSHGFHAACIDLWLSRSVNCPLCMKTLI